MNLFQNKLTTCPICQSPHLKFELSLHYWREYLLNYEKCDECGATFSNPFPTETVISKGNSALVKHYESKKTFEDDFKDARQAYLRGRLLAQRLMRIRKKGRLLDLGCYSGFLLLGVKEHSDWEVEGLEISDTLSQFIQNKLGITCHNGTLESLKLKENQYDFILCHDLIEHIHQPNEFLLQINRILAPGGKIEIITPNAIQDFAFPKRAYEQKQTFTMLLNHIMMFSPKALSTALKSAHLKINRFYLYDIRNALKDFGYFGHHQIPELPRGLSIEETLQIDSSPNWHLWDQNQLQRLRTHQKVSARYGFIRETLPRFFTLPLPPSWGVGHEIYALAEKPHAL